MHYEFQRPLTTTGGGQTAGSSDLDKARDVKIRSLSRQHKQSAIGGASVQAHHVSGHMSRTTRHHDALSSNPRDKDMAAICKHEAVAMG